MSKTKSNGCLLTFSFLISTIFSLTSVIAIKNYIPLVEEIAGTYFVSYISGMLIRDFLMRVILTAVGIVAFLIFLICGLKGFKKPLFPYFTVICGIFLLLIPNLSAYTFSRFVGTLLSQTVTGTIIIINACLMTIGSGFGIVAVIDFVRQSINLPKEAAGTSIAMILSGFVTGFGIANIIAPIISASYGLIAIFTIAAVLILCAGISTLVPAIKKLWEQNA